MATVEEVSAPYANFLVPVLGAGSGVCEICHGPVVDQWTSCYQCSQAVSLLTWAADVVVPMTLAVKGAQLAYELWAYKNNPRESVRRRLHMGLAAVLWRWLADHENCVARAAGTDSFSLVTTVPSAAGRTGDHPLERIVGGTVGLTSHRYERVLAVASDIEQGRAHHDSRFRVRRSLDGERVLLVDDTWTTGAHAQSAASALRARGAEAVGVVVIGRHFSRSQRDPYREAAENYLRAAKDQGWDWATCCVEWRP